METFNYFIGFISIVIIGSCLSKECNKSDGKEGCNLRPCGRLLKRDFIYCTSILVFCIIVFSTIKMGDNKVVYNYISFASTITSMILSVLAIMMTLLAESKSDEVKMQMANFINKIEDVSKKADQQVLRLEHMSKEVEEKYNRIESKLDNIAKKQKEYYEKNLVEKNFKTRKSSSWENKNIGES